MHFDCATYMATYFSQNMVPLPSRRTYQHVCSLCWLEVWIWWETIAGHKVTRTVFSWDQGPDGVWSNHLKKNSISLWLETNRNVHQWETQEQRFSLPVITITWHENKCKLGKLHWGQFPKKGCSQLNGMLLIMLFISDSPIFIFDSGCLIEEDAWWNCLYY